MALSIESFNIDNLIFEDVKKCVTGDVAYQRIPIKYLLGERKVDLCLATPELMTFGVQENRQKSADGKMANLDKPVESYSLPLVMANEEATRAFEQILEKCKEHLKLKMTQKALNKFNLAPEVMDIFYRKRDEGELVAGAAPTMYPKLFTAYGKRDGGPPKITTEFYDMEDEIVDPTTLIGVKAKVIAAITVRDIYIGAKPSIQLKVNDAIVVEKMDKRRRLLVAPPKAKVDSVMREKSDSEEEDVEKQQPTKVNKIVRRKQPVA